MLNSSENCLRIHCNVPIPRNMLIFEKEKKNVNRAENDLIYSFPAIKGPRTTLVQCIISVQSMPVCRENTMLSDMWQFSVQVVCYSIYNSVRAIWLGVNQSLITIELKLLVLISDNHRHFRINWIRDPMMNQVGRNGQLRHTSVHQLRFEENWCRQTGVHRSLDGHGHLLGCHDHPSGAELENRRHDRPGTRRQRRQRQKPRQIHRTFYHADRSNPNQTEHN